MNDQIDQLAKLNELKASGALTEEEFAEQKKKLLQSDSPAPKKKTFFSLRSPKLWILSAVIVFGYQLVKYGSLAGGDLPSCGSSQATNMVVELLNKQVRENPFAAMIAGGSRAISISSAKELHSDPAIRACEGVVKRNNGEGEVGYTIEMGNKEKGEFWVHVHGVEQVRAMFAKEDSTKPSAPAVQPVATSPAPTTQDLSKYLGEHPNTMLNDPSVKEKFAALFGSDKAEHEHFMNNLSVAGGVKEQDGFYFGEGQADHLGGVEEAAFAINKSTGKVFAIILVEGKTIKWAGVKAEQDLPPPLLAWNKERSGQ
ncbi:SHOCT domain-containing protein [Achromobacter xylosoxidans]|uniref:SHOCT domain-containing protein n=1 Tax=Alcaligenes xylosoxydans xylosoxydans TaxID=85698 RepID=UPI001F133772|nr:SHOCT domain-containing protein [Achromobacter xylosoxidans]